MPALRIRVGICEDHPTFRVGIRTLITETGDLTMAFEVDTLGALRAAIVANPVDVLLVDIMLPDGSGLDAVSELARLTRVVMLSAVADPRSVRQALGAGATGFLRKDSSPDEIVRSIRRAAAGQTVLAADVALALADSMRAGSNGVDFRGRLEALTPRQREVLSLVAEGHSNREIATKLFVSEGTIKNHVSQILDALGVSDRTRLAVLIARHGLGP